MFSSSYFFPFYRSPYAVPFGYPIFGYSGIPNYNNFSSTNLVNSAYVNQAMNVIGAGAVGGFQSANPIVIV